MKETTKIKIFIGSLIFGVIGMTVLFGAIVTSKCEEGWWRALSYCTIKQKEVYIPNVPEGCTQTDIITKGNVTINTFICKTTV